MVIDLIIKKIYKTEQHILNNCFQGNQGCELGKNGNTKGKFFENPALGLEART